MTLILVFFICYYPPLSGAQCAKTPIIFNFGDSNSDTGGFAAAYGNSYSSDRMCDGRLIIDFLWPLGCLPNMLANVGKINAPADYDNLGCLIHPNEVASEFNKRLGQLCEEMRSELNDSVIVYVDMYTIKYNIISDYALYGFEKPLMACYGGGGAPYNANIGCGQNGSTVCEKGSRYISWDGIHYSESANMIFAAQIASKKFSTPPISFDYFCS
nr:GDSL esterase/lipase At1g09390-like [Ipomoea trifida]